MSSATPQIGFDRFIQLDWAAAAFRIRAGLAGEDELTRLIDASHAGAAAKKKTRTVLNRLWLEPRADLVDFADRGVGVYRACPETSVSALTWGMAIATYPFFGKVAEIVGRLTALQGDCASAEVHRRMAETYGEREGTRRMTNMVLQSQASWGAIKRTMNGKRLARMPKQKLPGPEPIAWLIESALRYSRLSLSVSSLENAPILFPFQVNGAARTAIAKSKFIDVFLSGSEEHVTLLTV
jgi:hypothetical protein